MPTKTTLKTTLTIKHLPHETEAKAIAWFEQLVASARMFLPEGAELTIETVEADVEVPGGTVRR